MSKSTKTTTLSQTISTGGQSVHFVEVLSWAPKGGAQVVLRVRIKSDSYSFQSHAVIEAFEPARNAWNQVACLHHGAMETPAKLCYHPDGTDARNFTADRDWLVGEAVSIMRLATAPSPERSALVRLLTVVKGAGWLRSPGDAIAEAEAVLGVQS